ncbi:unnamed protein product [Amoebophrya sp. A120]|nr:unnamed protein product [Amoebophrya sp. A120]|eukprot:GSA120T00012828001.1
MIFQRLAVAAAGSLFGGSVAVAGSSKPSSGPDAVIEDLAPKVKINSEKIKATKQEDKNKGNKATSASSSDSGSGKKAASEISAGSSSKKKAGSSSSPSSSSTSKQVEMETVAVPEKETRPATGRDEHSQSKSSSNRNKADSRSKHNTADEVDNFRIEVGKPFQIIQPTPDHQSMRVNAGNLARLSAIKHKISLISVVGPYHSGKSFLLNTMLGNMRAFSVGPKTSPETMGIWLCRTNMTSEVDGSEIWLMDSEGFFGPGIEEAYDAKIFTIATLLGSHLVYNTVKVIDQQAVNLLEMLARRAQLFKTKSGQVTGENSAITPDFLMQMNFPSLTWIVEDFTQDSSSTGENSLLEWLRSYLSHEKGSNLKDTNSTSKSAGTAVGQPRGNGDHYLSRLFKDISVKTLFLPAVTKADLKDLSKLNYNQLTEEFREELETDVKPHILQRVKSKSFSAKREHMTGVELQKAIHFIVNALQTGVFPELPSLWASWTTQVAEHSLYDSERWFRSMVLDGKWAATAGMDDKDHEDHKHVETTDAAAVVSVGTFNDRIALARERTLKFYTELLKDFDVKPETQTLEQKMGVIQKDAVSQFSHRIHRHFRILVDDLKEKYNTFLTTKVTLPHEPKQLEQLVKEESSMQVRNITTEWNHLSKLNKHAEPLSTIPWTEKNPKTSLAQDLETLAVAKHAENEKVIQNIFQTAAQASLTSCDSDLSSRESQLFGKQQMKEFREQTRINADKFFQNHLNGETWFKFHPLFKTHEALVKQETDVKLQRFQEMNEQRIAIHMREVHDKAFNYYKEKKNNLKMPMDEEALAEQHGKLKEESVDVLAKSVEDLKDTVQFIETQANLERKVMVEWGRMTQKNVELWKIHNDEVTQCGLQRNFAGKMDCGFLCPHTLIPFLHKANARQNLMDCFRLKEDKISAKMGKGMQEKIFVSWYEKELAYEANSCWNNFFLICGTILVGIVGIWYSRQKRKSGQNLLADHHAQNLQLVQQQQQHMRQQVYDPVIHGPGGGGPQIPHAHALTNRSSGGQQDPRTPMNNQGSVFGGGTPHSQHGGHPMGSRFS